MSALTERLIAARDALKMLGLGHYDAVREAHEVMANAANTLEDMTTALRRLCLAARTTGGVAGPDAELMAACDKAESAIAMASQ